MADPALGIGQYSIGKYIVGGDPNALVYGKGFVQIQNTAIQTGPIAAQDQPHIGADGMMFGVDAQSGMIITQTGYAFTLPGSGVIAMDAYSNLAGKWNDPNVRLINSSMQVLRANYAGSSVVRRAFGRGRQIQPALGQVFQGLVPFTAQFQAADNYWYSDTEFSSTLGIPPALRGTFSFPATPPYQYATQLRQTQGAFTVGGVVPTWPRIVITGGQVTNPSVTFLDTGLSIGWNGTLGRGEKLTIDAAPWARSVTLPSGGSAAAGMIGTSLINLKLQPGLHQFTYSGQDFDGLSTVTVFWRNAWLLPGGSNA